MDYEALLDLAVNAALKAGEEILAVYQTDFTVETKSDNTPVTLADKASSKSIIELLASSGLPSISEEEPLPDYELRKNWDRVWIIDPLDGTREFVKRNGEFTVNIALIENQVPVIGVIYVPVWKQLYFAARSAGSFMVEDFSFSNYTGYSDLLKSSRKLPLRKLPQTYTLVASRSFLSHEISMRMEQLQSIYGEVDLLHAGSSIKQCWVAEGKAHEYSRFGTTMEWDTAAGQCILEQSGNALYRFSSREPLLYNKENPENPYFIACHLN
ncbi:MAG TPA: 3'(2'),5'-bisphosphate nucleotidase CysQ [Bacteroidia bacterium]|nr:3'(2'),5'-bisphosphate nucleotidase CysQ [Bacteroidia bacterium]